MSKLKLTALFFLSLLAFTVVNPYIAGDILAFLVIVFFLLYKLFGDYALLVFLIIRPTIDYWRDYIVFSDNEIRFNVNAGISLILLAWSVLFFIKHREYWKKIPIKNIWITFLAWIAITYIYTFDKSSTITEGLKAANLFALFGVTYVMRLKYAPKFDRYFRKTLLVGAIPPLILAIYQYITNTGLMIDGVSNRIYGTFAHPNILATFALLLFIFSFDSFFKNKERWLFQPFNAWFKNQQDLYFLTFLFLAGIITLTYTRIAWIGFIFFLVAYGIIKATKPTLTIIATLILLYAAFFPVNRWLTSSFNINLQNNTIIARLTTRNREADSIAWRRDVANKVFPLLRERPLLGYGYGSFATVWDANKGIQNIWDNTSEAHNDYLKVTFESGLIGSLLFIAIFISLLYREIKYGQGHKWPNTIFILSILVYLILSLSDNMLHHTPVIWWIWAIWGYWSAEHA